MLNQTNQIRIFKPIALFIFLMLGATLVNAQKTVSIYLGSDNPKVQFAADELKNVLVKAKYEVQSADLQQADIVFLAVSNLEKSGEKGKLFSNSGF